MSPTLLFLIALITGYALSLYVSRPVLKEGKYVSNRLPRLKLKNIEILPNLRIHFRNRTYWLHHWVYLSIITAAMFVMLDGFSHLLAVKGAAIGGIIQGLRYPDRFKFRHPRFHH